MTQLYHNAIRRDTNETLTGNILIIGNLAVYGNINLTGLTNGIDLSTYEVQSPMMEDSLTQAENALTTTLGNQCSSLAFITNALAGNQRSSFFKIFLLVNLNMLNFMRPPGLLAWEIGYPCFTIKTLYTTLDSL